MCRDAIQNHRRAAFRKAREEKAAQEGRPRKQMSQRRIRAAQMALPPADDQDDDLDEEIDEEMDLETDEDEERQNDGIVS